MFAFTLLVVGFALVAAEVFFPSAGVLSLLAGTALVASIVIGFATSMTLGWAMLVTTLVGLPLVVVSAFRLFPRTPMGRRMIVGGATWDKDERAAVEHAIERFVGCRGRAVSPLRPAGIAHFGDQRVDVITRGEHIESGTPILALHFAANRLVVEASAGEPAAPPSAPQP